MKIIFLDIDGVLNTDETIDRIEDEYEKTGIKKIEIDEFRVGYLKRIVEMTDAKIVLSSSLRYRFKKVGDKCIANNKNYAPYFLEIFSKFGLEIYDVTPKLNIECRRQDEIKAWLFLNKEVDSFVILDDETTELMDFVGTNLIILNKLPIGQMVMDMRDSTGLCEEHITQAIDILNKRNYSKVLIKNRIN